MCTCTIFSLSHSRLFFLQTDNISACKSKIFFRTHAIFLPVEVRYFCLKIYSFSPCTHWIFTPVDLEHFYMKKHDTSVLNVYNFSACKHTCISAQVRYFCLDTYNNSAWKRPVLLNAYIPSGAHIRQKKIYIAAPKQHVTHSKTSSIYI